VAQLPDGAHSGRPARLVLMFRAEVVAETPLLLFLFISSSVHQCGLRLATCCLNVALCPPLTSHGASITYLDGLCQAVWSRAARTTSCASGTGPPCAASICWGTRGPSRRWRPGELVIGSPWLRCTSECRRFRHPPRPTNMPRLPRAAAASWSRRATTPLSAAGRSTVAGRRPGQKRLPIASPCSPCPCVAPWVRPTTAWY
jgi:hypothetical protein